MRRILKASALMGLSSIFTVVLSVVRYKVLALHLGAEGVGLLGLLVTALTLGVTVFGLGIGNSGVRQVAAAQAESGEQGALARAALLRASWLLGLLSAASGLILAPLVGPSLFPGVSVQLMLWLVVAVAASIVSSGQVALLNGLGRLPVIAKANVFGALIGTVLTVLAFAVSSRLGLPAALAATPLATLLLTSWYVRPLRERRSVPGSLLWESLKPLLLLGIAFSGSILLGNVTQLLVRVLVGRELGLASVGYFQAAWTVASVYLGFVLNAMAAEYYPRISAIAHDAGELNAQVNKQVRIALLLASPVILLMMLFAPLAISLMYARGFGPAVELLRWQLLGDVLKVASWPVGFLLLAREAKRAFFVVELVWNVLFLAVGFLLLQVLGVLGLKALGLAYIAAYGFYFLSVLRVGYRLTGFLFDRRALLYLVLVLALGLGVEALARSPLGWLNVSIGGLLIILSAVLGLSIFGWWGRLLGKFHFPSRVIAKDGVENL